MRKYVLTLPLSMNELLLLYIHRYTRNLVDAGNGKYNLMIVCWGEGHGSAIHDHAGTHCFMKMLQGELREIRYDWPSVVDDQIDGCPNADIACQPDANGEYNSDELNETSRGIMELNSVRYINGKYLMAVSTFRCLYERAM